MTAKSPPTHREFEPDDHFGRAARAPGGVSRAAALARAAAEVEIIRPQVSEHITQQFKLLDAALRSARAGEQVAAAVAKAYAASQELRDVAESVGYPLVGHIATNLCTIFEAIEAARIGYPAAIIDCHFKAMSLAMSRRYRGNLPEDLPELSAGLMQIAQIAKAMSADDKPIYADENMPAVESAKA